MKRNLEGIAIIHIIELTFKTRKRMRTFLCIFVIIGLMFSCTPRRTGQPFTQAEEDSVEHISLLGKNLPYDSILWGAAINFVNDNRIIIEELSSPLVYGVYGTNSEKLVKEGAFLRIGNGPFEFIQPYLWGNAETNVIYAADFSGRLRCIYKINIEDIYNKESWKLIQVPDAGELLLFPSIAMMNDTLGFIVGSGLYSDNILSVMDFKLGTTEEVDGFKFPGFNAPSELKVAKHVVYCDAQLLKHPTENKIVYAGRLGRYIEIFEIEGKEIRKRIPVSSIDPSFRITADQSQVLNDDCLRGVLVRVTKNRIYSLMRPYTEREAGEHSSYKEYPNYYGDELMVYDWEGNLINAYRLDVPIVSFGVTNDDSVLYGTTLDKEDLVVRKYDLKNPEQ